MRRVLLVLPIIACTSAYAESTSTDDAEAADAGADAAASSADAEPGEADAADAAPPDPEREGPCLGRIDCTRYVFVSSSAGPGNTEGLTGADTECQGLAGLVPKLRGRQFRAWLSLPPTNARDRVPHGTRPYVRTDGVVVARDFASMFSAPLLAPINVDDKGIVVATSEVWTGTNEDGTSLSFNCGGWTSAASGDTGRQGSAGATDAQWTDRGANLACSGAARLYCFEN